MGRSAVKIERAVLREVRMTLAGTFRTSAGVVSERRLLLLTVHGEGLEGWGECVAQGTPHYTYETTDTAWHVLTDFLLPKAVGMKLSEPESVLGPVADVRGHPMAKATLEMAVWDLLARVRGVSLSQMLGGIRARVDVGVSLGMMPEDELLEAVEGYLGDGYRRVKVKIAPGRDIAVISALRKRFPDLALWADANSSYRVGDAARLQELDGLGLELLEEPLSPGDLLGCSRLQEHIETPICLDESISSARDTTTALELGSCRVINLKPGRVGGLAASRGIYEMLMEAEVPVWCGGMLETGIGRAHNLALASLGGFKMPGDISASRRYWKRDIVSPEHEVVDGKMAVPSGPGIGVEVDVERVESLTVRTTEFG